MRKFIGVAVALALAGGAAVAAASIGQDIAPADQLLVDDGQKTITKEKEKVWVTDGGELLAPKIRRLAVLAGRGSQLGVSVRELDQEEAKTQSGALVEEVREDSPAERAGLRKGDVITEFDGERVRGVRHLTRLVSETPDGRTVTATVVRDGTRVDLPVTPESGSFAGFGRDFEMVMPDMRFEHLPQFEGPMKRLPEGTWSFRGKPGEVWGFRTDRGRLGVRIQSLDGQLGEYFGASSGVLISSVDADSPAARAGLKAGDVVTAVNGKAVSEPSELVSAVSEVEDGATLSIDYVRDKKPQSVKVELPKPETGTPKKPHRVSPV